MSYETDKNIEDRIISIITNKLNDDKFKKGLENDKIKIIEQLFNIFPDLEEQKQHTISNLIKNNKDKDKKNQQESKEIILDGFAHNNQIYYKDKHNCIWDDSAECVGIINGYDNLNKPICVFFDDNKYNLSSNINDFV